MKTDYVELFPDTNTSYPFDVDAECTEIHDLNSSVQCLFATTAEDCVEIIEYIDYNYFVFCTFGFQRIAPAVIICIIWLAMLFISLGVTANYFLCPALFVISKHLGLSQNVAGVTLLAFGNGSPDIFSSVAGLQKASAELAIASLVGAGVFVTTVVAGSVFLTQSFSLMIRPFLRDVSFYIIASSWAFALFFAGPSYIYHGIGFVALYFLYIVVVLLSRVIYVNRQHHKQCHSENTDGTSSNLKIQRKMFKKGDDPEISGVVLKAFYFAGIDWFDDCPNVQPTEKVYSIEHDSFAENIASYGSCQSVQSEVDGLSSTQKISEGSKAAEDRGECREFMSKLCPVNLQKWPTFKCWERAVALLKSPAMLVMTMTVPVISMNAEDTNWCRLLVCTQCITGPMFITLISENAFLMVGDVFPLLLLVLILSSFAAVVVFCTSQRDNPPVYQWLFAYLGFAVAVSWTYCLANEIVALLQVFGVVFNLSDAILGLTVLAWGNSLSDFLSNLAVARKEFPRMGISACFGGPLLALLLGLGIPCIIEIVKGRAPPKFPLRFSGQFALLFAAIGLSLTITTTAMILWKFQTRRGYGGFLLLLYTVFVVLSILDEIGILSFGL